jgi:hypothetical protein
MLLTIGDVRMKLEELRESVERSVVGSATWRTICETKGASSTFPASYNHVVETDT